MNGRLTAVCVVHASRWEPSNPDGVTAIDKRPVTGAVQVGPAGLTGDRVGDPRHHGGPEQAVYAYADEDAGWWADELDREITPGLFGENLRTTGIDVTGAEIGERWRVGEVLLQVTAPRIPCQTFARRMNLPKWVRRFSERGAPGAYLAVLEPGSIAAGDPVVVEHRPGHGVTIGDVFLRPEPAVLQRLLEADGVNGFELMPKMRQYALTQAHRASPPSGS